jgi:CheY-like chemotaxis protein
MTRSLNVLVAEDSEELRAVVMQCVESLGHSATGVATGREAISLLQKQYFDLLVTDVLMPDADGIEVIVEAKKRHPTTRVIAMTGGGRVLDPEYCIKVATAMGAHVAILKPFRREEFIKAIHSALPSPANH